MKLEIEVTEAAGKMLDALAKTGLFGKSTEDLCAILVQDRLRAIIVEYGPLFKGLDTLGKVDLALGKAAASGRKQ